MNKDLKDPDYLPEEDADAAGAKGVLVGQDKLKKKIEGLRKEKDEYLEGWQRERASFANYRQAEEKRKEEFRLYATGDVLKSLLDIMDNLVLADKHAPPLIRESAWFSGLGHIEKQFKQVLESYGVSEVKADGEKFNPEVHESLGEVESDREPGTIIEVAQKGYKMGDILLRPARVKIAKTF